ncbi:MAG TPA: hypothetical protein VHC69_35465 [Polyangiaceae bacterium]|nr:hypothetical protein [Polyangiaceae bacterium]
MRLLGGCAVLALAACSGCDEENAPRRIEPPSKHSSAAPSAAPSARAARDGGVPELPLRRGVRRAMKLAPLRVHDPGVAIGKGRIGVLTDDALVVHDATKLDEVARVPLHEPIDLVVTADGGLLAFDRLRTKWLMPQDTKPRAFPPAIIFPLSSVFVDRSTPNHFGVVARGGKNFYEYALEPSPINLLLSYATVSLDRYDGRLFVSLRDGSYLYSTETGFLRFFGAETKEEVSAGVSVPADAFRLLPASRVDTLWFLTAENAVLYRLVAGKLWKLRTVPLSAMALDADTDGIYLAVLELAQPDNASWSMTLEVFDANGVRHVHEVFSISESLDAETWVRALERNRRLAVRDGETPLVAVGGPDELNVFRADSGARVGTVPKAPTGTRKTQ